MKVPAERGNAKVVHGADHVVESHEVGAPQQTEYDGAEERADEAFDSFLRGQRYERSAAYGDAPHVCEHIVADDEGCGYPEPDETLEDVVHNEVTRRTRC